MSQLSIPIPSESGQGQPQAGPYPYADYTRAKRELLRALRLGACYGLIVGHTGMGKTCLAREVAAALDPRRYPMVYVSSFRISTVGVVRLLAQRLHLAACRSHLETVKRLAQTLQAHACHFVLWFDDADHIPDVTLVQLRMVAEFNLEGRQLFSVVLSALPRLSSRLEAPHLLPLRRRISIAHTLLGLHRDELDPFLQHRFGTSGAERVPRDVREELFERTQASPALVDRIIRQALTRVPRELHCDDVRAELDAAGL